MEYIQKNDRVASIEGDFKGYKGFVTRTHCGQCCVVFKGVWEHGIWVDISTVKRTKRYKRENNK